jgi:hypothetical protein
MNSLTDVDSPVVEPMSPLTWVIVSTVTCTWYL